MSKEKINFEEFQKKAVAALEILKVVIAESKTAQDIADKAFDIVEDYIVSTKTKVDDAIGLPACKMVRALIGVPDND